MPTTSLPGMGASMRIERAARAIARSSAQRLDARHLDVVLGTDLVLGHDRAGVDRHDLGRDREAEQLLLDAPLVRRRGRRRPPTRAADARLEQLDARQDPVDRAQRLLRRRLVGGQRGRDPRGAVAAAIPRSGRHAGRTAVKRAGPDGLADRRLARARGRFVEDAAGGRQLRGRGHRDGDGRLGRGRRARAAVGGWRGGLRGSRVLGAPHRVRRRRADPAGRAGDRREQLPELEIEREHEPEHRDRRRAARTCPARSATARSVPARKRPMRPPPRSASNSSRLSTSNAPSAAI